MRNKYIYEFVENMELDTIKEVLCEVVIDYFKRAPTSAEKLWYKNIHNKFKK